MPTEITSNFRVKIAGDGRSSAFALSAVSVSQVSVELPPERFDSGGSTQFSLGRSSPSLAHLRISCAVSNGRPEGLHRWWEEITNAGKPLSKRTVEVWQTDNQGNLVAGYRCKNAWLRKMGLNPLGTNGSSDSLTEFYEFVYEDIEKLEKAVKSEALQSKQESQSPPPKKAFAVEETKGGFKYGKNIQVTGDAAFLAIVKADLAVLAGTKTGQALLASIDEAPHSVSIEKGELRRDQVQWEGPFEDTMNGKGAPAKVLVSGQKAPMYKNGSKWDSPQTAVTLGHELIHASHVVNGNIPGKDLPPDATVPAYTGTVSKHVALEERRTVGLGADKTNGFPDYTGEPFTENKIRSDLGEPQRTTYLDPTAEVGTVW